MLQGVRSLDGHAVSNIDIKILSELIEGAPGRGSRTGVGTGPEPAPRPLLVRKRKVSRKSP